MTCVHTQYKQCCLAKSMWGLFNESNEGNPEINQMLLHFGTNFRAINYNDHTVYLYLVITQRCF